MSTQLQPTYRIHAYNLVDLVTEVAKATQLGYVFDFKTISHFPQQLGYQFIMTMVLPVEDEVKEDKKEAASEASQEPVVQQTSTDTPAVQEAVVEAVKTPGKPGRKANGAK